jgi:hypothetical protein
MSGVRGFQHSDQLQFSHATYEISRLESIGVSGLDLLV